MRMSSISKLLKRVILWLLGNGRMEFLLEVASRVVMRIANRSNLSSEEKRQAAIDEINKRLKDFNREYSKHLINLAIELALIELKENLD